MDDNSRNRNLQEDLQLKQCLNKEDNVELHTHNLFEALLDENTNEEMHIPRL